MGQQVLGISLGDRLSFARIVKLASGGAIGGLITFLLLDRSLEGRALFGNGDISGDWVSMGTMLGAVIGFTIGACLIAAEEWHTSSVNRIMRRSLTGALAGALCGALGGLDGQFTYSVIYPLSAPLARCIGWALLGAGAGICPGMASHSLKRAELGAFGGLLGGAFGGAVFDALAMFTRSADLSRAIGFILVGAAIGIAVGFLEEIAKEYWVTVLSGSKEGQSYSLSNDDTTIGRAETVDIPLFGDNSVQKVHAHLLKSPAGVQVVVEQASSPIAVNSSPVTSATLSNGDLIGLGKHKLRFSSTHSGAPAVTLAAPQQQVQPAYPTMLQVVSGPHAGAAFALSAAVMRVGRSSECEISLPGDDRVSRSHAAIIWDGASWRIEDNGSTNGLYVNGQRVSAQVFRSGDEITVGSSTLRAG